ncbi:hypothetical protein CCR75_007831 [Bremia lactucae]|uniref:Uncharacterized protein n=1 Tax=Bremia lactucae TaxID=4779 RepID=A0A976IC82_BRELC|nr:hypothetical protein CCR75_007831 [Bremia lactucae]
MKKASKVFAPLTTNCAVLHRPLRRRFFECRVNFFSNGGVQMGTRLTAKEIAERRAKRLDRRPVSDKDMAKNSLFIEGSMRMYYRHLAIVEPVNVDPKAWPAKLDQTHEHILSSYMAALTAYYGGDNLKARKSPLLMTAAIPYFESSSLNFKTNLEKGAHDILVFPDSVRVHNITPSHTVYADNVSTFAVQKLVNKSLEKNLDLIAFLDEQNLRYTRMEHAYHMMVCGHASRDERCGCKGPKLLQWLKELAPEAKMPLNLWISSHYGGHRYAAACIVYPSGDWFGLLNDKDKAKAMLDAVNNKDPLCVYKLWRGRIGLSSQEIHHAMKEKIVTIDECAP